MYSLSTFEHQLVMYVTSNDKQTFAAAFDVSTVPVVSHEQALAEERTKKLTTATPTLKAPSVGPPKGKANGVAEAASAAATQKYAEQLLQHPDIKEYGALLKSSVPVELTESETEYVVTAVKHVFKENIVVQYDIKNTLPDTVLENVTVIASPSEDDVLEDDFIIPAPKLSPNEPGVVYVAFKKLGGEHSVPIASFTNILKFTSKEIEPTTGEPEESGYDDEYQVEDLELTGSDYVIPTFAGSFDHVWEQTGANGEEESETLQLSNMKGIAGMFPHPFVNKLSLDYDTNDSQMPPSNSSQPCLFNLWRVPTLPLTTVPTRSSSSARPCPVAASPLLSRWPTPARAASQPRSLCGQKRRALLLR
jgi:coatomer protein complex subunit gamma